MERLLLWISNHFTFEHYLVATKIQGLLWSIADIVLVYFFLKIAELSMSSVPGKKITYRYWLLWLSAFLTPFLLITKTKNQFFILDSVVCGIQYLILLYTLVLSGKRMQAYILEFLRPLAGKSTADG